MLSMSRPPEEQCLPPCLPPMPRWKPILALMVVTQFCSTMGFSIIFPFLPLYLKEIGSTTGLGIRSKYALSAGSILPSPRSAMSG